MFMLVGDVMGDVSAAWSFAPVSETDMAPCLGLQSSPALVG